MMKRCWLQEPIITITTIIINNNDNNNTTTTTITITPTTTIDRVQGINRDFSNILLPCTSIIKNS